MAYYHMIIEGALALTGQNFVTDYFEKEAILPGYRDWLPGTSTPAAVGKRLAPAGLHIG